MKNDFKISKFFALDRNNLFEYWIQPQLLEKWACPDGMYLKVPVMEARAGGKYRFEHRGFDGLFISNGYFKEFIPAEKLVQVDTVKNPEGFVIFQDLECITTFKDSAGGTEVIIEQKNFVDEKMVEECRISWEQSLEKLSNLFKRKVVNNRPDISEQRLDF
jgi:uncharacterized protein YndB with AHSA1/START domain